MKAPTGKLALAYRSLAVAEERAERFMAERDALQALLNERDAALDHCRALLQEWRVAPILQHTEEQADTIDSLEGMTRGALK